MTEEFGPYRLEHLIGRGGMGEVHRAWDTRRGRTVALKRLPSPLAGDPEFQARFRRESALAAQLSEPHIIPIHDFGEINGTLFIDMRLVDGTDLASVVKSEGPMAPRRAIGILAQVAGALDAAHAAGLVHRDVKPSNVLVRGHDEDEFAYLIDFGIARAAAGQTSGPALTLTGATLGTLDYMAPERFENRPVDGRADVYSLACMLFELLTGAAPFRGRTPVGMIHAHVTLDPPRPSAQRPGLPPGLDDVVVRGMAKRPEHRYPTAGALVAAARAAVRAEGRAPTAQTPLSLRKAAAPSPAGRSSPHTPPPTSGGWAAAQNPPPAGWSPAQSPPPAGWPPNPAARGLAAARPLSTARGARAARRHGGGLRAAAHSGGVFLIGSLVGFIGAGCRRRGPRDGAGLGGLPLLRGQGVRRPRLGAHHPRRGQRAVRRVLPRRDRLRAERRVEHHHRAGRRRGHPPAARGHGRGVHRADVHPTCAPVRRGAGPR